MRFTAESLIRAAIQKILDDDEGWQLDHVVLCLGLERMRDGKIESTAWVWAPPEQADYVTDGLLRAAVELREDCDDDAEC